MHNKSHSERHHGFTLIELMVVVAVVAILAAVAFPSYTESVRKGKRAEGRTALLEVLQQQERYMTQNNTYLAFSAGASNVPFKTFSGDNSANASYNIGARACTGQTIANCVQVFGTPKYTDPLITEINITSTGVKGCTPSAPSLCWK